MIRTYSEVSLVLVLETSTGEGEPTRVSQEDKFEGPEAHGRGELTKQFMGEAGWGVLGRPGVAGAVEEAPGFLFS